MAAEPAESKGTLAKRTARAVINEAIRESAPYDTICWWGLVIFGLTGVATIWGGLPTGNAWMGAVGTVPSALCWPTISYALSIRRANIVLRLLELTLNDASTAKEALTAIHRSFGFHFGDEEGKRGVVLQPETKSSRSGPSDR